MAKFAGPFSVVKQVFDDAYKLALPPEIKVHLVFHASLLKEHFEDSVQDFEGRAKSEKRQKG